VGFPSVGTRLAQVGAWCGHRTKAPRLMFVRNVLAVLFVTNVVNPAQFATKQVGDVICFLVPSVYDQENAVGNCITLVSPHRSRHSVSLRRGSQVVRPSSAKALCAGSIPARASNFCRWYGRRLCDPERETVSESVSTGSRFLPLRQNP
jgi:hypothetical protein